MKAFTRMMVLVLVCAFVSAYAQTNDEATYIEMAQHGYLKSLDSEVDGVRSSAAFLVVKLKSQYPDVDVKTLVKKLKKLSDTDSDLTTRIHCQMAVYLLESENETCYVDPKDYVEADKFFAKVYEMYSAAKFALK